ncbi:hypothetical protein MASR2M18_18580 [Ignavibacteria bacterium]|nr:SpoIIE family protein phosphatase [Bacteroidota bacterium]
MISPSILRLAAVLALVFRVILDVAFFAGGSYTDVYRAITSFLSLAAATAIGYLFYRHECEGNIDEQSGYNHADYISRRLTTTIYLTLIVIIGGVLAEVIADENRGLPTNILSTIIFDDAAALIVFASLSLFFLYYCVTQRRRHHKTRALTRILLIGGGTAFSLLFILALFGESSFALEFSAQAYLLIVGLLNIRRLQWVDAVTSREKRRLLWLGATSCATIIGVLIMAHATDLDIKLNFFLPGLDFFFKTSSTLAAAYCARLTLAALMALPTAGVVDRRNSEVDSLAYLNRIVAETVDFEKLTEVVTEKARLACNASAAWIEMHSGHERIVTAPQGISYELIEWVHINPDFAAIVSNCDAPCLIESLGEHPRLATLAKSGSDFVRSLIAMPLLSGTTRIGTLIVVKPDSYGFEHDDLRLLTAFRDNVSIALENARLLHDSMQNERIKREMTVARTIQQRLLPQQIPTIDGFDIGALSYPAYEVGGDYYDILRLGDGSLCILIGDVSGKGIPAAFYMAQLKGAALALAREVSGARDFLSRINATLFGNIEKQIYITLLCVVLRENPASMTIARAGHMPALFKQHGGVSVITPKGLGVGLASPKLFDRTIEEFAVPLAPGDACLLFTDGVSESRNQNGDELGYEPLIDILRSPASQSADAILKEIGAAAERHKGTAAQHDDVTAVAFVYRGTKSAEQNSEKLSIVSTTTEFSIQQICN